MPLQRRLPKRGFNCPSTIAYNIINISDIESMGLEDVSTEKLLEVGAIKSIGDGVKILGNGNITRAVKVKVEAISAGAKQKIEAAGGSVEVL